MITRATCWLLLLLRTDIALGALLQPRQTESPVTDLPSSTATSPALPSTDSPDATSSSSSSPQPLEPSRPSSPAQFPSCSSATVGPFPPFCLPHPNSSVWVSNTYYTTWDPDAYAPNSTVTIELIYANTTGPSGISAYSSARVDSPYGYMTIAMEKDWLQGHKSNNLTFFIVNVDPAAADAKPSVVQGPTVKLTTKPVDHDDPPPTTPVPDRLGLFIGLPLAVVLFVAIMGGLMFGMRKHRSIGLGNIMGRRRRGYSMLGGLAGGHRRGSDGGINLERYKDEPHGKGTLNDLFEVDQHSRRIPGQAFREDVRSLKGWKT